MIEMDDADLVDECIKGNPQAFGQIVDRYEKVIFNLAYRMSNSIYDAEDITQNVFIKVYENLRKYNRHYKFFSWLYRMAVNESLNLVKFRKKLDRLDGSHAVADPTPEIKYQQTETEQLIQAALMSLKADYRLVMILKHFQNFSYEEIARVLKISEKKVKSRLYTARQLVGQILTDRGILNYE
jgi:RNA polymerase sigma-70 factor (ECF subfamily)